MQEIKKRLSYLIMNALFIGAFMFACSSVFAEDPGVPDSIVFGNFDGSPILAGLNAQITIPIYVKTDDSVNFAHIPMATDDNYISTRDGAVFYEPFSLWDDVGYLNPDLNSPLSGYTSQSILGFAYIFDPRDPQNFLHTNGQWVHIADFKFTTTSDISVLGDTTELIEGINPANGNMYFGLSDGITTIYPAKVFSPIYFPPNTPPVFGGTGGSNLPVNEQFGICLNISATDDDNDSMVLTAIFGPNDFTFQELENVPGSISYEFCWVPSEGSAGSYPITFTVNDGNGGVINLDYVFDVTPTNLTVSSGQALPGDAISLPVSLHNPGYSSMVGGFEILLSWNNMSLTLNSVIRSGRLSEFEYFFVNYNDAGPGTARIVGIANLSFGDVSPPLQPDTGSIFILDFSVSQDENLIGVDLPVEFLTLDLADNTLSDSTGYLLISPELNDGIVSVIGPDDVLTGDINLNGVAYEIGDVVLFVNHLVFPAQFPFNSIQIEASDINADGLPLTVADLVLLINIVNGSVSQPRIAPPSDNLIIEYSYSDDKMRFSSQNYEEIGAILVKVRHELGLEPQVVTNSDLTVKYNNDGEYLTILAFMPEGGGAVPNSEGYFEIIGINEDMEIAEISASDAHGNLLTVISRKEIPLPLQYKLSQNYPNPFNASTVIAFELPQNSEVSLGIFNITGQKIGMIFDGYVQAGRYEIFWDSKDNNGVEVASGVYFYKLTTNNVTLSKKMTLLK